MGMEAEIDKLRQRADLLERLRSEFPDLREYRTRWRTVLVSKKVNAMPEGVYTNHSCGCCDDAPLQAWFWAERESERIYTDPPTVYIGEKNPWYAHGEDELNDEWDENWEEVVRKHVGDVGIKLLRPSSEAA